MKISNISAVFFTSLMLSACDGTGASNEVTIQTNSASISAVTFTGEPGNYNFSVTIASPDTGCEQYADWWEVFRSDGTLIYRRILAHSHVDEQPFTRSGGPVSILNDEEIIVRAHMNNLGYGTEVFKGSINQGLIADSIDKDLASELTMTAPLPNGCAF